MFAIFKVNKSEWCCYLMYYRVRGKWGVTQYTHTYISCNDSVGGDASVDCGKEECLENR